MKRALKDVKKEKGNKLHGNITGRRCAALITAGALITGLLSGCGGSAPSMMDKAPAATTIGNNWATIGADGTAAGVYEDTEQFQPGNYHPTAAAQSSVPEAQLDAPKGEIPAAAKNSAPRESADNPRNSGSTETQLDYAEADAAAQYDRNRAKNQNGERYLDIRENSEQSTERASLLTFSLKVDTASYDNTARYLRSGELPPPNAVRTEEFINYFNYDAPMFFEEHPFSIYTEIGISPLNNKRHLALIRVKSKELDTRELPSSSLTLLIDTSGSMDSYDKLPLLKDSFALLVETLDEDDRVSIVTYAGSSHIALDSANGAEHNKILRAIDKLTASGSTAGANGIITAYELAEKNFIPGGNNRVILATDGDFNVGPSSLEDLEDLISRKRDSGVYLSILGFGTGNIRDDLMETLSKNGNGNYAYIHSLDSAKKVLVEELAANLFVIADDVKAQVEFNPKNVKSYRLIGYENRMLNNEDFEDDRKDASEIGVGTDVVMMFELELTGTQPSTDSTTTLKYQHAETDPPAALPVHLQEQSDRQDEAAFADELFEVRIRYKVPGENESKLMLHPAAKESILNRNSTDFNFAASVVGFGQLLRKSTYADTYTLEEVTQLAKNSVGKDQGGYRKAHIELLGQYKRVAR